MGDRAQSPLPLHKGRAIVPKDGHMVTTWRLDSRTTATGLIGSSFLFLLLLLPCSPNPSHSSFPSRYIPSSSSLTSLAPASDRELPEASGRAVEEVGIRLLRELEVVGVVCDVGEVDSRREMLGELDLRREAAGGATSDRDDEGAVVS